MISFAICSLSGEYMIFWLCIASWRRAEARAYIGSMTQQWVQAIGNVAASRQRKKAKIYLTNILI